MRIWIATVLLALPVASGPGNAHAQPLDSLENAAGIGKSSPSTGSGLGGMSMPSIGSASSGNIAGVLRYCVRNNYVDGNSGASVEHSLVGKLGGGTTNGSQFASGDKGMLQTGNGGNVSLGSGGLKGQMTQKICDQVLKHAKSLI